jgi:aspartate aminotransferase-like enzyme
MRAADLILFTPGPVRIPPLVAEYLARPPCNTHWMVSLCSTHCAAHWARSRYLAHC